MFERIKGNILFDKLLKRPDIDRAYAMVPETDSWYDTIKTVHESLDEISRKQREILEIRSEDGLKLRAVYYPCESGSDVTVICVHGYTSHAEREWAFPGLFYLSLGFNVLIPYQRAHGSSEGKYISFGALEHIDMTLWVKKINEMNPDGKIVIHGLSMGGGIVLDLSKIKMENVRCLIADAPSVSIEGFFKNVSKEVFKRNSDIVAEFAIKRFKREFGLDAAEFDGIEIVQESHYPILLAAGGNENLEETFDKIKNANPKETRVVILPGCNHGNGMYKQTELYQNEIKRFLGENLLLE